MDQQEAIHYVINPGLKHLPGTMDSPPARAMMLAIGMQESRFLHRRQIRGPARGFFQFERIGVLGVLRHHRSAAHIATVVDRLHYDRDSHQLHDAIEHNDPLAAVFARLLLWTIPRRLPERDEPDLAWDQYAQDSWRPGRPHRDTWDAFFEAAWKVV